MHVVAVTRWGAPLDKELPELASRLGMVAYDLRLRLSGGLPVVFVRVDDPTEAAEHLAFLRERGHGAVTCDARAIPGPEHQVVPVDFRPTATSISGTCTRGQPFEIRYADIVALVHVACVTSAEQTVTTQKKEFSPARAVLSGGMILRKTVDRVDKTVNQEQEQMIYLFCRSQPAYSVWKEMALSYQGLGDQIRPTAVQNFQTLSNGLRKVAPQALYDNRLLTNKRQSDLSVFAGSAKNRRIETSNASEIDVAAFLLVRGFLERQL